MIEKINALKELHETGIIAVIRVEDTKNIISAVSALLEGDIYFVEFTMTIPGALEIINKASTQIREKILVGAGSVLDPETARAAILSGAEFIVSPSYSKEIVQICNRYSKIVIPGAHTPTEIVTAWQSGADVIKIFPAYIGGPKYISDIKGPFPQIELIPSGGVNIENANEYIRNGAFAVAIGSDLLFGDLIGAGKYKDITLNARKVRELIKKAR